MRSSNVGGVDVQYGWDAANRLASVTDPAGASTFEYDLAGRLTKRTDPNGVVMTYAYDNVNRVLDVNASRGTTPIADYAYQRDLIGRVTTLTELSGRIVTYGYSVPGRLVNETITGEPHGINGSIGYTHDAVGNRLTRTSTVGPVSGQTFAYDANDRITTETYDLNGNTLAAEGDSFACDFEDRLVAIGSGVGLAYDGDGNLVSRTEAGVTTKYLVDEYGPTHRPEVAEEVVSGSSRPFAYGTNALRAPGQSYIADAHTDVRVVTDAAGMTSHERDYDSFGTVSRQSGGSLPVEYLSERGETGGLTYARARHVRRATGRFLQMDQNVEEISDVHDINLYSYASGDPENWIDREGHEGSLLEVDAVGKGLFALARTALTSVSRYKSFVAGAGRALLQTDGIAPILAAATGKKALLATTKAVLPKTKKPTQLSLFNLHHIIPQSAVSTASARVIWTFPPPLWCGRSIDDAANTVYLRTEYHQELHTGLYYALIVVAVGDAFAVGGAMLLRHSC
jgi:RHS repeat-associated protein